MSDIPAFPYEILWREREIVSVANLTRADGIGFLELASKAPVRTTVALYPLAEANTALNDLRDGRVHGAAVLTMATDRRKGAAMTTESFDLTTTYVHLEDGAAAAPVACTPAFWQELGRGERHYLGRLVMAFPLDAKDPESAGWEMHPAGHELLYVASGVLAVVFETVGGEETVELDAGQACIVPKGVWHRFVVRESGVVVAATAGEGTEHRPAGGD